MKLTTHLFGILIRPVKTIRLLSISMPSSVPWIAFGGFCVSLYAARFVQNKEIFQTRPSSLLYLAPLEIFLILMALYCSSAILHMTADFLGGGGRGVTLFKLILLDTLPLWLLGPLNYLLHLATSMKTFNTITSIILLLWFVMLIVLNLKEIYRFSLGRALTTLILPVLICITGFGATYLFLDIYGLEYFKDFIHFLIG